jgi:hypothetical protein
VAPYVLISETLTLKDNFLPIELKYNNEIKMTNNEGILFFLFFFIKISSYFFTSSRYALALEDSRFDDGYTGTLK